MPSELYIDELRSLNGITPITFNNLPRGYVIKSQVIRNSTRTAISNSSQSFLFGETFVKTKNDSNIVATCTVFGSTFNSGNCGMGMRMYNVATDTAYWDHGTAYQYDGAWTQANQTTIVVGSAFWQDLPAGTYILSVGWRTVNGGADAPFLIFNPNNSDDGRNQQMVSSIFAYEVAA